MSYFGTDGIRGRFGVVPVTPDFVFKIGFAAGTVLARQEENKRVVIGKDTRMSGSVLESALQAGFTSAGIDVYLAGVLPTPAIAHLTRGFQADAGVVISASHNPHYDNGIKFFNSVGKKLDNAIQQLIVAELENDIHVDSAIALGQVFHINDAQGRYIEFCKGTFPYQQSLQGLKIVVDCANGAGYEVAPSVFRELGATVVAIHNTPDGININEKCGSTAPTSLQQAVLAEKADIGIALDGDADRISIIDETGQELTGDEILFVLGMKGAQKPAGVVGTVMSNMGLELAFQKAHIAFERTKVGDRYIMERLDQKGWILGGESSGHILCLDKSSTGDAIIAGLQFLSIMVSNGQTASSLLSGLTILPQTLVNVRLEKMQEPYDNAELVQHFKQAEERLAGRGRLLIRKSGTEPVIRVMVESEDQAECTQVANELAALVQKILS